MLKVENLKVKSEDKTLLKGLNLHIKKGEIHALMGPNGAGKSSFTKFLAGHPSYQHAEGEALFAENDLLKMTPEERAVKGLFVSFQYPLEIPGVTVRQFLKTSLAVLLRKRGENSLSESDFCKTLKEKSALLGVKEELFLERGVNEGFSGGEKKRAEILQLLLFNPRLSILDEIDSGLDVDALKKVASIICNFKSADRSLLVISHYRHFLEFIQPDVVHVMIGGEIVYSGSLQVALEIEKKGYDFLAAGLR